MTGHLGLGSQAPVGILGKNCEAWLEVDLACLFGDFFSVPIHTAMGQRAVTHVISEAKLSVVFCSFAELDRVIQASKTCSCLRTVVLFSQTAGDLAAGGTGTTGDVAAGGTGSSKVKTATSILTTTTLPVLTARGATDTTTKLQKRAPGTLHTAIYTSGSTGMAKGVMIGDECWNNEMISYLSKLALSTLSYMPVSHITDRLMPT